MLEWNGKNFVYVFCMDARWMLGNTDACYSYVVVIVVLAECAMRHPQRRFQRDQEGGGTRLSSKKRAR